MICTRFHVLGTIKSERNCNNSPINSKINLTITVINFTMTNIIIIFNIILPQRKPHGTCSYSSLSCINRNIKGFYDDQHETSRSRNDNKRKKNKKWNRFGGCITRRPKKLICQAEWACSDKNTALNFRSNNRSVSGMETFTVGFPYLLRSSAWRAFV